MTNSQRLALITIVVLVVCGPVPHAQPAPALRIVVLKGEDAVNIIQQKTAVAPLVEVRDRNNLPVAGATVTFSVGSGATFSGASTVTVVTNAAGQAVATGLTPTAAGAIQVQASALFQGQTALATITQSNVLTAAQAAAGTAGNAGAAGGGGAGGGGISGTTLGIVGGVAAAGAVVATQVGGKNSAPAVAAATATPSVAILGTDTAIRFSAQATDPDNDALTYQWEFGDGETSTETSPTHIYRSAGAFTARVTVRDDNESATAQAAVNVKTLTGTWQSSMIVGSITGTGSSFTWRITQSGTSLAVASLITSTAANEVQPAECQYPGTVTGAAPRVSVSAVGVPCVLIINGVPGAFSGNRWELEPSADGDTLSGTMFPTPRAITFTRR
jgi:PKD repeat protein